jgi:hypothetical protein
MQRIVANMGEMFQFPEKREPKAVEDLYRREFGYVICPHKVYLPNQFCQPCCDKEAAALQRTLFGN